MSLISNGRRRNGEVESSSVVDLVAGMVDVSVVDIDLDIFGARISQKTVSRWLLNTLRAALLFSIPLFSKLNLCSCSALQLLRSNGEHFDAK